ncbi:bifunctional riboflavin kinase/FAD synthetase [Arundinibacter roseus]|uniref:Riboflavin biosynthesis protein n=1 Tax=Arundinibacter roseus TaxID=2070510 RepID=A0A4R4KCN2_9BACT|nr:bifunctional riboflavin kinase/FAD synthetase [Arundinibacter roseus]TDB64476.1 bifunctional riboflavin kinase/FAD synthetase [Arundinibacter roseus]
MKVYHSLEAFQKLPNAVVTSGTFDGVHKGHQQILSRLIEISQKRQGQTVVLTFWPHPRLIVSEDSQGLQLLSTIEEKIELFSSLGIDHLIITPFTRAFSELSSIDFIQQVLVDRIGTKKIVIGYDHRFGRNREGSFDFLQRKAPSFGFEVEEIPRQDIDALAISSTRIRAALLHGEVEIAQELLGRPYSFSGVVVKGKQLGRTLGFPTANIEIREMYKLIPANGAYVIETSLRGKRYGGMLNIGVRPTVDGLSRTIEAHLFDFSGDIYGEKLSIRLLHYLRPEQKFENIQGLIQQLAEDKQSAIDYLSSVN